METQDIEFWRHKANDYEWMWKEQKDICDGYRRINEEKLIEIKDMNIKILELNNKISLLCELCRKND